MHTSGAACNVAKQPQCKVLYLASAAHWVRCPAIGHAAQAGLIQAPSRPRPAISMIT